eukprot:TRINITY_DN1825_c0_g1_i1.p1 TRINITY_DN1825_c0_g1~~TRINITY_DN1825_c0_g1_i1.p1  ORF type:complete len:1954 (+),score=547.30 TRINITY_DN1825_c0_g1_i1:198-6059(+)
MNLLPLVFEQPSVLFTAKDKAEETSSVQKSLSIPFDSVRIPLSPQLLEDLETLRVIAPSNESEVQRLSDHSKRTLDEYCKQLEIKPVPQEILAAFSNFNDQKGDKLEANWKGIVLKVHIAALENDEVLDVLKGIRKTKLQTGAPPTPSESRAKPVFPVASETEPKKGTERQQPQLLKTGSPFIPIKTQREPQKVMTSKPAIQEPANRSQLTRSSPNPLSPNHDFEIPLSGSGPSSVGNKISNKDSFDDFFDEEDQFYGSYKHRSGLSSTSAPNSFSTSHPMTVGTQSSLLASQNLGGSQSQTNVTGTSFTGSGSYVPPFASPSDIRRKTSFDPDATHHEKQSHVGSYGGNFGSSVDERFGSLPPSRLGESLVRSSNLGQSFVYSKNAPLPDPVGKNQQMPPNDLVSPSQSSFRMAASTEMPPEESAAPTHPLPEISPISIISPSSYFRRAETEQNLDLLAGAMAHFSTKAVYPYKTKLPDWTDVLIFWGDRGTQNKPAPLGVYLEIESVLLALHSRGHYDFTLRSALSYELFNTAKKLTDEDLPPTLREFVQSSANSYLPAFDERLAVERLRNEFKALKPYQPSRFMQYGQEIIFQDPESLKTLNRIEEDLLLSQKANHQESLCQLEKLLISLLGDPKSNTREVAVRLLNVLYDGHDWQNTEALIPLVRTVGDSFALELDLADHGTDGNNLYVCIYAPLGRSAKHRACHMSYFKPVIKGTKATVTKSTFKYAGYYDWRFVTVDKSGQFKPLVTNDADLSKVQGRVIVQPHVRDEIVHEVWADLQDCEWDRNTGNILKRGNFAAIKNALPQYKRSFGASTLYVMGALDRQAWGTPFSPTDRATPNKNSGGAKEFDEMVTAAHNVGIKVMVDATARVSARAPHRKYKNLICQMLDENEMLVSHPGSDGHDFKWEDCVLLNYRKKATWDLMVSEIREWAKRGVSGVRLDAAHSWPLILQPDLDELLRLDSDGQNHYTLEEILDGHVVQLARQEGINYGYHGTNASQSYPNPLFVKMTRELWEEFPNFVFFAEIYWGREVNAAMSGLIPFAASLPTSVASIFNVELHKDGRILFSPEKRNVSSLYNWYEIERARFPQNSIILYPSSSHHIPYPTSVLAHGAWAAIDLLFFLPEIPSTYIGEQLGWMMNADVTKNKFVAPEFTRVFNTQRDLVQIKGHYEHRASLRKNYAVLREGGMIPLFTFYGDGWHDRVFAFARFTKHEGPEIAIIAINFNDVESIFYIDCSPLKEICENTPGVLIRTIDLVNPSNPPQYYSTNEFLYERNFVRLPAYASLCWGVFAEAQTPTAERVLFEHSMLRLQRNLFSNVDPSNNLVYDMLISKGLENMDDFSTAILDISRKQGPQAESGLPPFLQSVIYYTTWGKETLETKALAYLEYLAKNEQADPMVRNICKTALQYNLMGPIVFITPEIGRFSTVGGVGVMVNELTQALAALGFDVHIISPYYNYNRKGQTGYLKAEGIDYVQNVSTYVGNEYVELGVHKGKEHGVTLHFLHNWKYFSTPYHTGSPQHQLQTIVLIAKASLEYCCQLRLLPSIIVTNDWFCGLVPAYAKRSGAFGTTFQGTTFMHVVHNLEEGYEGKIYPEDEDDLSYIHQLSKDLIMEPYTNSPCLNASRCALLAADQWGTVSVSYRNDLMRTSPLSGLLCRFPNPFAMLNGIRLTERMVLLNKVASSHEEAKRVLQLKYFQKEDPQIPVFSFVGRIVLQKGVHLILNSVGELISASGGKIQIIVGGMANMKDPYAAQCAWSMQALRRQYPQNFWADPNEFFSDGSLLNLGSDFGLMPSLFEPSGVVQQEYFSGGTPVIVFKTGGLKDSVFEFDQAKGTGNGFTFEAHSHGDFVQAVRRSLNVFNNRAFYAQLRQQARDSVLDMETVAIVWTKEFTRLRKRTWVPPAVLEKFTKEYLEKKAQAKIQEKTEETPDKDKTDGTPIKDKTEGTADKDKK